MEQVHAGQAVRSWLLSVQGVRAGFAGKGLASSTPNPKLRPVRVSRAAYAEAAKAILVANIFTCMHTYIHTYIHT